MSIGNSIKELRQRYHLTQAELGEIAGVSDKAVSSWENGNAEPRMGALERMAQHFGITKVELMSGGEKIIPLSHDQARQWAEHSLDAEEYEKLFVVEEDEKIIMTISISDSTRDCLKKLAAEKGMPMSAVVEELVLKA